MKQKHWNGNTILSKHAARVVQGPEADQVRRRFSHRIMGSRFVMTIKQEDDTAPRVKARWCLQGHLDPDLTKKIAAGDLQSPLENFPNNTSLYMPDFQQVESQVYQMTR